MFLPLGGDQVRYVKISKENTIKFLERLKALGTLYAPQNISELYYDFCKVDDVNKVVFEYNRTVRPPRRFFYPERETMFKFNMKKVEETPVEFEAERIILFGVHACDIVGLRIIDATFLDDLPDPFYRKRRENGIIIGISCLPDEYCFCNVRRVEIVDAGFDLFFHELPDGFLVRVKTVTGHKLVDPNLDLFEEGVTKEDTDYLASFEVKKRSMFSVQGNWDDMRYHLEWNMNHPMYDRESEKCLGCGNCTTTCPTCRCYEVKDIPNLDGETAERVRFWDSCQFRTHGLVAGGHNFRPTKKSRFFNRYHCKNAYCQQVTTSYCVGCGRCTYFCPAQINFKRNLLEIRGEI